MPSRSSPPPSPPLDTLRAVVDELRRDCPWDAAQTLSSMRPYLLEETHELLGALDAVVDAPSPRDPAGTERLRAALRDELGDLLFVLLLVARICEDEAGFSLDDAARAITAKMKRRHPHLYGTPAPDDPGGIAGWEARKSREQADPDGRPRSRLAGVPAALPGLLRAHRQGEKAASVGFDWPDHHGVLDKVREEVDELAEALAAHPPDPAVPAERRTGHPDVIHELGDVLMALSDLGRHAGAPAETALRRANDRFRARFAQVEALAFDRGQDLSALDAAALDALWEEAKARLAAPSSPEED